MIAARIHADAMVRGEESSCEMLARVEILRRPDELRRVSSE